MVEQVRPEPLKNSTITTTTSAYPQMGKQSALCKQSIDYGLNRATPLESCQLSPAQLSMSRRLCTKLPVVKAQLPPAALDLAEVRSWLDSAKRKQKQYHDQRAAGDMPVLLPGDPVRVKVSDTKNWLPGTVVEHHKTPRSYVVECSGRKYRRNRKFLRLSTYQANTELRPDRAVTSHDTDSGPNIDSRPVNTPKPTKPATQSKPTAEATHSPQKPKSSYAQPDSPKTPRKPEKLFASTPVQTPSVTMTRSGRQVKPPQRLD